MTEALTNLTAVAGSVITFIEGNTILLACMCMPIFGWGVSAVRKLVGRY